MKTIITNIIGVLMTTALAAIILLGVLTIADKTLKQTVEPAISMVEDASHFDTKVLETWCGAPQGKIRMVGGWYYEPGVIEDENGNLWGWDGELEEEGFYLLWIDNCNTESLDDDEIVKFWKEVY